MDERLRFIITRFSNLSIDLKEEAMSHFLEITQIIEWGDKNDPALFE